MPILQPVTDIGAQLVKIAEEHAADFATQAAEHDRAATYPEKHLRALGRSGFLGACVPTELGGMGVESVHDLTVAISRLAHGDGSTAIGATMHAATPLSLATSWRMAVAAGTPDAEALAMLLRRLATPDQVLSFTATEPGTTALHPLTTAHPVEGGWALRGRKTFVTNAPLATLFVITVQVPSEQGPMLGLAIADRDNPGLTVVDTWDALGMRGSGSHDLLLTDAVVPGIIPFGPWGRWDIGFLSAVIRSTYPLLGAFVGLAEAARDTAVDLVTHRRKAPSGRTLAERSGVQHMITEIEVALAAARATLARTALAIDDYFTTRTPDHYDLAGLHQLMADYQTTNLVSKRAAITAVDHALAATGGAGYLNSSPLARIYRDVRAGPFMQPYSPLEASEYIARVTLGLDPALTDDIR